MPKNESAINLIENAKTIAIVPSKVAGADSYTAAAGLYYMLLENGKDVNFIYQGVAPEKAKNVIEQDRVSSNVGQREVVISIDYSDTPAAQAHYATKDGVLEIKLGPIPKNFDLDRVRTKLSGFDFDLIIVIGAQEVADLGNTYTMLKDKFSKAKVINIDNTNRNEEFGDVNIVDINASTLSSLVFSKAAEWNLVPNEKASMALLTGMTYRNTNLAIDNS